MFRTVLVANRGEIAVRIIATLRRLGIRSVAVYSDADAAARHVAEADVAMRLGPPAPRESYLHIERIMEAARSSGAEALHPGYGFLAENADLARACAAAGVVFVGPSPEAIELMGDKIQARAMVAAAGVPVVPGRGERGMSDPELVAAADEVGFPLLIKPSGGGGGKGMRVVTHAGQLADALAGARREAVAAFGDDALFLERYVTPARHIEVQIFADTHGTAVHLGERECSLQRRQQKVVEETPSPFVSAATRERLGAAAIAAGQSVDYIGAGTVEFIVEAERPDEFFFMEMNTRLQVEHPVTEMVTGLDLVEHQLRVAAGEPLDFGSVPRRGGHAVEARVYAEDPARDFLPTGGRVLLLRQPAGDGIRVDSGIAQGTEVGTEYDPLLTKMVAWGPDRSTALARLEHALSETVVLGVRTNVAFLRRLVTHPEVVAGHLDTGLVERLAEGLADRAPPLTAYAAYALNRLADAWPKGAVVDPWDVPSGWRLSGPAQPLSFTVTAGAGEPVTVTIGGRPEAATLRFGTDGPVPVSLQPLADGAEVSVEGTTWPVWVAVEGSVAHVWVDGESWELREVELVRRSRAAGAADGDIRSPMPGTVIKIQADHGATVHVGQPIVVVEAMKMEHVLVAPRDGTVDLLVAEGDLVAADEVLARIAPEAVPAGEAVSAGEAGSAGEAASRSEAV
jgi:acetyl-CoA/propionyl-CoA carboxylase biotin carboxyl carrier protein